MPMFRRSGRSCSAPAWKRATSATPSNGSCSEEAWASATPDAAAAAAAANKRWSTSKTAPCPAPATESASLSTTSSPLQRVLSFHKRHRSGTILADICEEPRNSESVDAREQPEERMGSKSTCTSSATANFDSLLDSEESALSGTSALSAPNSDDSRMRSSLKGVVLAAREKWQRRQSAPAARSLTPGPDQVSKEELVMTVEQLRNLLNQQIIERDLKDLKQSW
eukprot:gnl/TRDRNA2_/TRDRNA2_73356_c0_seq1.p1 gnl/TRDRNA2_/TRDRNA2_73356_c0~~gnl/TRDRNA2_/TRDRNA2_73356_c0_seq1.p1  ORF type:complete len:224 (+),score=29.94 gnl/TRDRNA2_/TRDRNA2_73356_c0_seq1:62-733(+)